MQKDSSAVRVFPADKKAVQEKETRAREGRQTTLKHAEKECIATKTTFFFGGSSIFIYFSEKDVVKHKTRWRLWTILFASS